MQTTLHQEWHNLLMNTTLVLHTHTGDALTLEHKLQQESQTEYLQELLLQYVNS